MQSAQRHVTSGANPGEGRLSPSPDPNVNTCADLHLQISQTQISRDVPSGAHGGRGGGEPPLNTADITRLMTAQVVRGFTVRCVLCVCSHLDTTLRQSQDALSSTGWDQLLRFGSLSVFTELPCMTLVQVLYLCCRLQDGQEGQAIRHKRGSYTTSSPANQNRLTPKVQRL